MRVCININSIISAAHYIAFKFTITDRINRPYLWAEPNVIVICYSSIDTNSFEQVESVIWPELNERYSNTPIILVATKCDARPDEEIWSMDEGKKAKSKSFCSMELYKKVQNYFLQTNYSRAMGSIIAQS